uniref:Uncharacterized protein n=1 Tax=Cucumis melo TaxID=3656 RepID=A0A9I9DUM3_CUCME
MELDPRVDSPFSSANSAQLAIQTAAKSNILVQTSQHSVPKHSPSSVQISASLTHLSSVSYQLTIT